MSGFDYSTLEPVTFKDGTEWRRTSPTRIECSGPRGDAEWTFDTPIETSWVWLQVCLH